MSLKTHPQPIPNVLPPLDYVEKNLIKDAETAHWFWRERKGKRVHDASGQAILIWSVDATHKTDFVSKGRYNVARLLYEAHVEPLEPRAKISSRCGLPQCVNPSHWGREVGMPEHRIVLMPGGWYVAAVKTGKDIDRPLVAHIRDRLGIVHAAVLDPPNAIIARCGAHIDPEVSVIVDAPVTCKAGCR